MDKSTSKIVIITGLIVVAAATLWFVYDNTYHAWTWMAANQTSQSTSTNNVVQASSTQYINPMHNGLTYTQALKKYTSRIQFSNCHGAVGLSEIGSMSIQAGLPFMLDNRDPLAHTFAFASQSYRIAGDDFAIVSVLKGGVWPITCDGGGAASLSVSAK
jgi:hypothetical protein